MKIIDTHVHYNLEPLLSDWQNHWQNAQSGGVIAAIIVGTDVASSTRAVAQAEQIENLKSAVAMHPGSPEIINNSVPQTMAVVERELDSIDQLAASNQVIAIGECGLDYFRLPSDETATAIKELQKLMLSAHLDLATKHSVPLIIHLRDKNEEAYWDFLDIYRKNNCQQPFILHCVSGPSAFVQQALQLGAYLGIAGNVTYPNAAHLRSLITLAPKENILLETDAPYLPPMPYRGKTCLPEMIELTAHYLEKNLALDAQQFVENAKSFFPALREQTQTAQKHE